MLSKLTSIIKASKEAIEEAIKEKILSAKKKILKFREGEKGKDKKKSAKTEAVAQELPQKKASEEDTDVEIMDEEEGTIVGEMTGESEGEEGEEAGNENEDEEALQQRLKAEAEQRKKERKKKVIRIATIVLGVLVVISLLIPDAKKSTKTTDGENPKVEDKSSNSNNTGEKTAEEGPFKINKTKSVPIAVTAAAEEVALTLVATPTISEEIVTQSVEPEALPLETPTTEVTKAAPEVTPEIPSETLTETPIEAPIEAPIETPIETPPETPIVAASELVPEAVTTVPEAEVASVPSNSSANSGEVKDDGEINQAIPEVAVKKVDAILESKNVMKEEIYSVRSLAGKIQESGRHLKLDQEKAPKVKVPAPDYDVVGKGLVYNCKKKHWACVDREQYFQCKNNLLWAINFKSKPDCVIDEVFATPEDCFEVQKLKINQLAKVSRCQ
ncbi:MAG: hypothetical protein HQK52_04150 [Oligoflexia bacterium]|nr:hypothetical protein [Oligoflexia bacterium]